MQKSKRTWKKTYANDVIKKQIYNMNFWYREKESPSNRKQADYAVEVIKSNLT